MAQIISNKFPLDLDARKIIGFKFPLNASAVFNPTYQTKDQIKANLINYLLTNRGERLFNPTFGADLGKLLFSVIDNKDQEDLKQRIQSDINRFFPDVVINKIKFDNKTDQNQVNLKLDYSIKSFGIEDNININLQ